MSLLEKIRYYFILETEQTRLPLKYRLMSAKTVEKKLAKYKNKKRSMPRPTELKVGNTTFYI